MFCLRKKLIDRNGRLVHCQVIFAESLNLYVFANMFICKWGKTGKLRNDVENFQLNQWITSSEQLFQGSNKYKNKNLHWWKLSLKNPKKISNNLRLPTNPIRNFTSICTTQKQWFTFISPQNKSNLRRNHRKLSSTLKKMLKVIKYKEKTSQLWGKMKNKFNIYVHRCTSSPLSLFSSWTT